MRFERVSMVLHWLRSEKCERAFSNKAVAPPLKAVLATCFARAQTEKNSFSRYLFSLSASKSMDLNSCLVVFKTLLRNVCVLCHFALLKHFAALLKHFAAPKLPLLPRAPWTLAALPLFALCTW